MEEARLLLSLGMRFLHILLLQVGVLLFHTIVAELMSAHIRHTNVYIGVQLLRLKQALHQLSLLLLCGTLFVHLGV